MAQYTKLLASEIRDIAAHYNLKIISYQPIEGGAANSNYWVNTNQGKYIFTIFEIEPIHIAKMVKVLFLLERHEFPAPRVKFMANGEVLTKIQGKPVLVKSHIPGQVINVLDDHKLSQVGTALARLHEIPAPEFLPRQHPYIVQTYPTVVESSNNPKYIEWLEKRYRFLILNTPSALPRGLNHGDLFYDNVLFEGKQFKAIIDFEDSCHTYKIFDLGMAA
jgi:homoserine kinase type II